MPRITMTSVLVDDQQKALAFYTDVLGFVVRADVPAGDDRWLTVVDAADPDGVELLLEPDTYPAAQRLKASLLADGIPYTSFGVDDVAATYRDLVARNVAFTQPPTTQGSQTIAVLDDTCGNLIQLTSPA
jgi:catechol 2,3-dioxygenase-like lactoylglutathione lyase family enzyme